MNQELEDAIQTDIEATREAVHLPKADPIFYTDGLPVLPPLIFSQRDLQWMEWQEYVAKKIATIFGISAQELGVVSGREEEEKRGGSGKTQTTPLQK